MEKYLVKIIGQYYWFLVAIAASLMFGVRDVSSVLIIVIVAVSAMGVASFRWKAMDVIVSCFLIYSLITYFFAEYTYPMRLYYLGVRSQIIPMFFYFIARSKFFKSDVFFENIRAPLFFAMLVGVYFYFFQPSFYVAYKAAVIWTNFDSDVNGLSGKLLYEFTRMSSFWPHSYFIGYSSLFLFMYSSKKIVIDNCYKKFDLACFGLSFFCLFFAQQRVSIAFCLLFFFALTVYATFKRLPTRTFLYVLWICAIVFGAGIFFIVINYLDVDFMEYVLNRSVNYQGSIVGDRFALFSEFIKRLSFFGAGLGRYGHGAVELGYIGIPDSDYIRIPAELGIFGLAVLMLICVGTLFNGIKIFKYAFFEVCVICFALVAMIGAAVWELGTLQPFLYWFCLGHIQSKFERREKLEGEYKAYFKSLRKENRGEEENCESQSEDFA
ncbi:MAG: hypothetical protein MJY82_00775 [Fibrobacter sp.]|nr:hypothetical protein [Fibrobacter sp.]